VGGVVIGVISLANWLADDFVAAEVGWMTDQHRRARRAKSGRDCTARPDSVTDNLTIIL